MHDNYNDIKNKIKEPPIWYDQNGTPRYGIFYPDMCPNIYSNRVALLLIACQYCHKKFKVELHDEFYTSNISPPSKWHYGDPPAHDCVGDTMNCDDLYVLQFWVREGYSEWERRGEFEVEIK
jgi:hypothetical protein